MDVWSNIRYVGSALTLAAFIAAAAVLAYRQTLAQKERLIRTAREADRPDLVARALESLSIQAKDLTKKQQYELALEQLRARSHRFYVTAVVVTVVAILAAVVTMFAFARAGSPRGDGKEPSVVHREPTPTDSQVQLTTSGNAYRPAISPDGKFVVYVQDDDNAFSLRLRQTPPVSGDVKIVPASSEFGRIAGATISPGGEYVDFVAGPDPGNVALWRVPLIGGGSPRRLIEHVSSPIGWSPDGRRIAFVVWDNKQNASRLIVAKDDGTDEQLVDERNFNSRFVSLGSPRAPSVAPAWSPDGRLIAMPALGGRGSSAQLVFIDVEKRAELTVLGNEAASTGLAWLDDRTLLASQSGRLWRLSYPEGSRSTLTSDASQYRAISLTADRASVAAERVEERQHLWVGNTDGTGMEELVRPVLSGGDGYRINWSADRLLYTVNSGGSPSISRAIRRDMTPEEVVPSGAFPTATKEGRVIVYVSVDANNRGLWRMDADGRSPRRIVRGACAQPILSADDREVFYFSGDGGVARVSIDGGTPTKVTNGFATQMLDSSPDGKKILFGSLDAQSQPVVTVCDLPNCSSPRNFKNLSPVWKWTPNSQGLAFVEPNTRSDIWVQPLDGTMARKLITLPEHTVVADFAWSRDATHRLAVARYVATSDLVLFRNIIKTATTQ